MMTGRSRSGIDTLRVLHEQRKSEIRSRLAEFSAVPRSEYFYELAYCILTPQSSARNAGAVIRILRDRGFQKSPFDPTEILRERAHYIRFHATKGRRLLEMRNTFDIIHARLAGGGEGEELRSWLVQNVKGLGWKEASHFLRNIGYRNLAILDRHILRNLHKLGIIRRLPASLTPREYQRIEKLFRKFSDDSGIPMDEMDLLFWSMETGLILK